MTRHLAIKKALCERCHIQTLVVKQGFFAGWGRSRSMDVDAKRKLDGWTLPIHEIVKRRREWLWEVGRQEEGKRRRQDERESDGRVEGRGGDGVEGAMAGRGST